VAPNPSVYAGPTFRYGGDFNLPILDKQSSEGSLTEALIQVPDHLTIYDLDVGINLTHTCVFDLHIYLQSPDETKICLNMYDFSDEFFVGENYTQTIFDDEAEIPIEQAEAPFTGRFRPKDGFLLSEFDNRDAYGVWRLQVYDMWYADTGSLESVELIFSISEPAIVIPEPAALSLLVFGAGLTIIFRRRS
jgi:hypothetical protein